MSGWVVAVVVAGVAGVLLVLGMARATASTDEEREAEDRIQRFGR